MPLGTCFGGGTDNVCSRIDSDRQGRKMAPERHPVSEWETFAKVRKAREENRCGGGWAGGQESDCGPATWAGTSSWDSTAFLQADA